MALDMNNFTSNQQEESTIRSDRKLRIGIIGTGGISGSHINVLYMPLSTVLTYCSKSR